MDSRITPAIQNGAIQFFGKQPLPPNLGKGPILNLVANHRDFSDFDRQTGIGSDQPIANIIGL
jgi:hypothetical protein